MDSSSRIKLKTDDLITEKAKNQKNLDVVLSGFVGNKDNSDIASKISDQIFFCTNNSRKIFEKKNEKNKSFILLQQTPVNHCISRNNAIYFIFVSFILLWFCSHFFPFSH